MALKAIPHKSKFVYHRRDPSYIKERATTRRGSGDSIFKSGVDIYRMKNGTNLLRIMPPTWPDAKHYVYQIFVHRFVGSDNSNYLCLFKMKGKRCPCCEAAKEAKGDEERRQLQWTEQWLGWAIDRDGEEKPQVVTLPKSVEINIASVAYDERKGSVLWIDDPDKGYDVTIKKEGSGLGTKYLGISIARESSPLSDNARAQRELLEFIEQRPIPSMLQFFPAEHIEKNLSGGMPEGDEDLDDETESEEVEETEAEEEEEERPTRKRPRDDDEERPPRKRSRDDEEERPPRKRASRDDDDNGDEETEEEESPLDSARLRKRPRDDEEDRPPRKRSRDDDEEDRPPRKRSRDDEEDRPPRKRASRDDDDGEETEESEEDNEAAEAAEEEEREWKGKRRRDDDDDGEEVIDDEEERPRKKAAKPERRR